jgi:RimJ/RimL family protein N-acetyltransferase
VSERYWPMFSIRLTTPELELRHLTEADLAVLADLLPDDAEQNPHSTTYDGLDAARNRRVVVHQDYWRALGSWRPESWALNFGVFRDGELVGNQGLEGDDFARLRTVDSFSFLAVPARGRGWGKQMRAAVLALAFGPLDAQFAITSAWTDNLPSLGVSRSLGYVDNGITVHRRGDGPGEMLHLRLTRETWLASGWPQRVTVTGAEECMAYFGLD